MSDIRQAFVRKKAGDLCCYHGYHDIYMVLYADEDRLDTKHHVLMNFRGNLTYYEWDEDSTTCDKLLMRLIKSE